MVLQMAPVRQHVVTERVPDVGAAVREGLRALPLAERVWPGMRIAVGVGSRGISSIREVVTAVVAELQAQGAQPFLVPAMGSHGGGTAEGQREVGIAQAARLATEVLAGGAPGIHLYAFNNHDTVLAVLREAGILTPQKENAR